MIRTRFVLFSLVFGLVITALVLVLGACSTPGLGEPERCPSLWGSATLDWGTTGTGTALIVWNDEEYRIRFEQTSFTETSTGVFVVTFDWHFPTGTISIIETAKAPTGGNEDMPRFESEVVVAEGGEGTWVWSGTNNIPDGVAHIEAIEGTLCLDT